MSAIFRIYENEETPIPETLIKADREEICEHVVALMMAGRVLGSQVVRHLGILLENVAGDSTSQKPSK